MTWLEIYCVWWHLAASQSKGPCQDPLMFRVCCCCPCLAPSLFYFEVLCHPLLALKCPALMSPTCVSLYPFPSGGKAVSLSFFARSSCPFMWVVQHHFPFLIFPLLRMDFYPSTPEMVYDFLPLPPVWFLTSGLSKCDFIHQNTNFVTFWWRLEPGCEDVVMGLSLILVMELWRWVKETFTLCQNVSRYDVWFTTLERLFQNETEFVSRGYSDTQRLVK